jgi:hypothetical protein
MESILNALGKFFGVVLRGQTYLNLLYLLLSFPLGIFYFVFLVTGISLGIGLAIVWVGLLILAGVFAAWYAFTAFERGMAIGMLREDILPMSHQDLSGMTLWKKFTATLANPVTWKGLAYLLAKFPLGIISFVVLVTLLSVSAAFLAMPFYYPYFNPEITLWGDSTLYPMLLVDTLGEAMLGSLIGVILTLVSLHILNGLAWVSGKFAKVMLGNYTVAGSAPTAPVASVEPVKPVETIAPAAPAAPASPAEPVSPAAPEVPVS